MYAAAFEIGAPLKVNDTSLPQNLRKDIWRALHPALADEFEIAPDLVNRFNAWRQVTLGLEMPKQPLSVEEAARFGPVRSAVALEQAMKNQLDWLTAWRINRYAGGTLLSTPFFHEASNRDAKKAHYEQSQQAQEEKQQAVLKQRKAQRTAFALSGGRGEPPVLAPGVPDFDPEIAQKQLREAAAEFSRDYRGERRELHSTWQFALDDIMGPAIYVLNSDDDLMEYLQMKLAGEALVKRLFRPVPTGKIGQPESPESLLVALYDNQVHDSRAWFMYSSIGSRERGAVIFATG